MFSYVTNKMQRGLVVDFCLPRVTTIEVHPPDKV